MDITALQAHRLADAQRRAVNRSDPVNNNAEPTENHTPIITTSDGAQAGAGRDRPSSALDTTGDVPVIVTPPHI
ncbi:hypothetical protein [Kitasatospora sp. NPDC097691]|uniref:hypothetical protein n=1 Tax=Kitasatospora sp. NPDC097691 TaxID=3157231 RepID=UPI00331F6D35